MRTFRKSIAIIISVLLIANVLSVKKVQAYSDVNIISNTSVTKEQAAAWAKTKGATDEFINLAQLYWKYSVTNGNVNPAMAYVQAAIETGYGKFGGVIDASFKNPCGLKSTKGGDNSDPNAHQKFSSWDQGVQAHLDHLALYAGANGYPRTTTPDPRHFSYLKGTANTVSQLSAKWASNTTYGDSILKLYWELNQVANNLQPRVNVESLSDGMIITDPSINIRGWALNGAGVKSVQIYVDDKLQKETNVGISRGDVKRVFPDYANAENSGFLCSLDTKSLALGTRTIKVVSVGNDGTSISMSKTINIASSNLQPRMNVESLSDGMIITDPSINVRGWALNGTGVKSVQIYVDDKLQKETNVGISRGDVKRVFPDYANAENSGFLCSLDTKSLAPGTRTIKVVSVGNDGASISMSKTVNISSNNLQPRMNVESISDGMIVTDPSINVRGWALNGTGIKSIQIYVDDKLQKETNVGISRGDVKRVFPDYMNAENSGFLCSLDTKGMTSGTKTIKVVSVGNNGVSISMSKTVNIPQPRMNVESISDGMVISDSSVNIRGWALNRTGVKSVQIYVDDKLQMETNVGISRGDVKRVFPEYINAENSGFLCSLDTKSLTSGTRTIKVVSVGNDGETVSMTRKITIKPALPLIMALDGASQPRTVKGATTNLTGWAINGAGIKEVRIYVDGNQVATTNVGLSRSDIGNWHPEYPNSYYSGYSYQLNIAQYPQGNKNIKVVAVGNDGSTQESSTTINIVKPLIVVDPGHNQGGDYGCETSFNGVTYSETTLTMQTAVKLQSELVNRGYRVQLTRQPWDNLTDDLKTSLYKRVDLANSLKADAFISIHYNSADSSSANGIQTFYSTYKPGIKDVQSDLVPLTSGYDGYKDKNPTSAGIKSRTFAKNVENALTSKCNYSLIGWDQDQHGYLDRNLYVTKYTNMPATLIELGFLSNSSEAKRCADSNEQLAKAKVIADEVSKMF